MNAANPAELLQELIHFDTPGNGRACIMYIEGILKNAGIPTGIIAVGQENLSLFAKLPSLSPELSPLLLYGHVDTPLPGGSVLEKNSLGNLPRDSYVRGCGAIGAKGQIAVFVSAMLRLKQQRAKLPFDVLLLVSDDGESGGSMKFLTQQRTKMFKDVKFAIGGIGCSSLQINGKKLYPITIAEKQTAHVRVTARGAGGAASECYKGKTLAVNRIAKAIRRLHKKKMPFRLSEPVRLMADALGETLGEIEDLIIRMMLHPYLTNFAPRTFRGIQFLPPLLRNQVNVTVIRGGHDINIVPDSVSFDVDLRLVPASNIKEGIADLRSVIGAGYEIEAIHCSETLCNPDMSLFDGMSAAIKENDPGGAPIPFVLQTSTEGRFLSYPKPAGPGIQCYGFTPINFPGDCDLPVAELSINERIPAESLLFATETLICFLKKHRTL